jgi:hypothetical protein
VPAHSDIAVVGGYFARCPLGGYAWQVLHYLLGLQRLGYRPIFYESTEFVSDCFDPVRREMTTSCAQGVSTLRRFFARFGLEDAWSVFDASAQKHFGLDAQSLRDACEQARLAISLAAVQPLPPTPRAVRVFIDLDPAYTQIRLAQGDTALAELLASYARHFTLGEHIGQAGCLVPSGGISWFPTRQPVIVDLWTAPVADPAAPFTTIGRWNETRRAVELAGERFAWSKRDEWGRFIDLPKRSGATFVLAMDADKEPADLAWLESHGWRVIDPLSVSADPFTYRDFILHSAGEFTTAKDLNIRLRTGWFSDRSACYLAAGRPVITHPTGFEDILGNGQGLFAVRTVEEAAAAVHAVRTAPAEQHEAARTIAAQHFAAEKVLTALLGQL